MNYTKPLTLSAAALAALVASQARAEDPAQVWLRFLDQSGSEYQPSILRSLKPGERVRFNLVADDSPGKPKSNAAVGLEATVLAGGASQLVSRNSTDAYGNKILEHVREKQSQLGYEGNLSLWLGKLMAKLGWNGQRNKGEASRDVSLQGYDNGSAQLSYTIDLGKSFRVVPIGNMDWMGRHNEKNDGALRANTVTKGLRTGYGGRVEIGNSFYLEGGILNGTLETAGQGSLGGPLGRISFPLPPANIDSQRIYAITGVDIGNAHASAYFARDNDQGDTRSTVTNAGVTVLSSPWSTKLGDLRLAGRVGYQGIDNHGYANNSGGVNGGLGISYALRSQNFPRKIPGR